jgi:hypothetical protein
MFTGLNQGAHRDKHIMKKIVLAAAVAAAAVSFATTPSFAKKMHKMSKCTAGHMMTGKADSMGWAPVMGCGMDGKMYNMVMRCYTASGMCPK